MGETECENCGAVILPATAERNEGLCAPCSKEKSTPPKVLPQISAYRAASLLLFINAITSIYFMLVTSQINQYIFSAIIDAVLAYFLFQQHEVARLVAIIRSILGLTLPVLLQVLENVPSVRLIETGVVQFLYCGALILFLGWKTVKWRFYLGVILGLFYGGYLGISAVMINA